LSIWTAMAFASAFGSSANRGWVDSIVRSSSNNDYGIIPVAQRPDQGDRENFHNLSVDNLVDAMGIGETRHAEGLSIAPDIDETMMLGCHHPLRPLARADLIEHSAVLRERI